MPKTKEQNERQKEERRQQILDTALLQFARNGISATKISDIAAAGSFSQGLVYNYFQSKEEIYEALLDYALKSMALACESLNALNLERSELLQHITERILDNLLDSPTTCYYHLLITQARASTSLSEKANNLIQQYGEIPHEAMKKILNSESLALLFWSAIHGLAIQIATKGPKKVRNEKKQLSCQILQLCTEAK